MRIICSWCLSLMRVHCPGCHHEMTEVQPDGDYVCNHGLPVRYSAGEVAGFNKSHGICAQCRALNRQKIDALARARKAGQ